MIWIILDTALIILALGSGVGCILLAMRNYNIYRFNYLSSFMYYQILLFIFGLYGLLGTIFIRSILVEYDIPPSTIKSMAEFIPYIGVPVILTAWFLFLKTSIEIVGKELSRSIGFVYFGTIIVSLLTYIIAIFVASRDGYVDANAIVDYSKYGFLGLKVLTFALSFFYLYRYGIVIVHKRQRFMVLWFANISLLFVVGTIAAYITNTPNSYTEKIYLILFFTGQIPSIVFLSYYLNKYFEVPNSGGSMMGIKEFFTSNYQLSNREWEIVEHICKGYTNGQVSEMLFISLQTVKDHVYRIYKKTGVKNRVQLVNMISTYKTDS